MTAMTVRHEAGDRFTVTVRGHDVVVDQPAGLGGADTAPTPTELFVASLAACVAFFGRRFLARHDLPEDLSVTATYEMSEGRPARVSAVRLAVEAQVPERRMAAFQRVLEHCTVHNSLHEPPRVVIDVDATVDAGGQGVGEVVPTGRAASVRR